MSKSFILFFSVLTSDIFGRLLLRVLFSGIDGRQWVSRGGFHKFLAQAVKWCLPAGPSWLSQKSLWKSFVLIPVDWWTFPSPV